MTLTAIRPDSGLAKGREVSLWRGLPSLLVDFGLERGPQRLVGIVGAEEVCVAYEEALFVRSGRSDHRPQGGRAPHGLGSSSRPLRLRSAEAKTTPGGRLDQSSHPIPHHTGNCSLINPEECLTIVDRFRLLLVVVSIDEPAGNPLGPIAKDFAGVGMKHVHTVDLDLNLVIRRAVP